MGSEQRRERKGGNGADGSKADGHVAAVAVERLVGERCRTVATIVNAMGIHLRPASQIATTCMKYASNIWIAKGERRVNGKSVMQLIGLEADQGSELLLEAEGPDAEAALLDLGELINKGFIDELPQSNSAPAAAPSA